MPPADSEAAGRVGARATQLGLSAGRELGRILWRRRLLVLACPAVVLGLTAAYVATLTPLFEARTLVAVDRSAAGSAAGASSERPALADELPAITSRAMAGRLVDRLDLQLAAEFNRRLVPGSTWGSPGPDALGLIAAALLDASPEPAPTDAERAARLRARIVDAVLPRIRAEPAEQSALSLGFVAADPRLAAAGATALADLYLEHRSEVAQQARERERQRLGEEVERLAAALRATENAIAELRASAPAGQNRATGRDLLDLTGELAYWRDERLALEARQGRAAGPAASAANLAEQPLDAALLGEAGTPEERELAALVNPGQGSQPSDLGAEPAALHEQRFGLAPGASQLEREIAIIRARETALEAEIAAVQDAAPIGQAAGDLPAQERQAETDRQLLLAQLARIEQLDAAPPDPGPDARIVVAAAVPQEPKYPRLALIYGTALGGALLLGGLLALGAEAWVRARP